MAYMIEIPVNPSGRLLVQAREDELPCTLELASLRSGEVVGRASESVEEAVDQIKLAIDAVASWLKATTADEVGILLGAETGAFIAKGTAELHFTLPPSSKRAPGQGGSDV